MYRMVARKVFPVFLAAAALVCVAGDLNPPPGPVTPTMKPLSHVEPRIAVQSLDGDGDALYVIRVPGSYYLIADIVGVPGKSAIKILASDVTLDLNGFALLGVTGSGDGIAVSVGTKAVTVLNGHVAGWGGDGVNLYNAGNCVVSGICAHDNVGNGITVSAYCQIRDCTARENGGRGIEAAHDNLIFNCCVTKNTGGGIYVNSTSIVRSCATRANGAFGIRLETGGQWAGAGSVIDCTANANAGIGIDAEAAANIAGCTVTDNSAGGIRAANSLIRHNVAVNNTGFNIDGGTSTLVDNHAP